MSHATTAPFDSTIQTTNAWLNELMQELDCTDRNRAYQALRSVLHALRDALTIEEVADLAAQLPMLVRGLYYEGWVPRKASHKSRSKERFLEQIAASFPDDREVFPAAVVWAVFRVLERHVSAGEIRDVQHILPERLRSLWPHSRQASSF